MVYSPFPKYLLFPSQIISVNQGDTLSLATTSKEALVGITFSISLVKDSENVDTIEKD